MSNYPKTVSGRGKPEKHGEVEKDVDAPVAPSEQGAEAQAVLGRLRLHVVEVEAQLDKAAHLLEANEQLVLATLRAQGNADVAKRALDDLARASELAAMTLASRSKSEFLSRVSHELRTPLNAILGFGQLMLMDDDMTSYLGPVQRERLDAIRLAGQQLLSLTNDILDLASIEHGRVHIEMETVDVEPLVDSSEILLRPAALERNVHVCNQNAGSESLVMADARALGQVLLNLMSKAVKYNRVGGWVKVRTEQRDPVVIVVEDNGIGMTEAQLADLFQPFNRLGAESGPATGCGLGLVISKALVELMGGKLLVHSVPRIGTRMEVHLSRPSATALTPAKHATTASFNADESATVRRTVLYIEDNPVNAMLVKQLIAIEPAW